ncbi:MAG TPA: class I SAM-dependent methyltransferase [Gaiellaceae bacterium]|nr:class I SAM-dependent methyltransferase [Gaiellaceae bacterium]
MSDWPGGERRHPALSSPTYAVRGPLAGWLEAQARELFDRFGAQYRVLDVGCGQKPYYPFFAPYASEYIGVDSSDNRAADLQGAIESLPVADASFDVVICTQVLEHCDDPAQAVRELHRVVRPGGRVLVSTHGVQVYHPSPSDYWRWTHAGLERLFVVSCDWNAIQVSPASGTTACLGMLFALYVDLLAKRLHLRRVARPPISLINRAARAIDARSAALSEARPGTLIANFHVAADR